MVVVGVGVRVGVEREVVVEEREVEGVVVEVVVEEREVVVEERGSSGRLGCCDRWVTEGVTVDPTARLLLLLLPLPLPLLSLSHYYHLTLYSSSSSYSSYSSDSSLLPDFPFSPTY